MSLRDTARRIRGGLAAVTRTLVALAFAGLTLAACDDRGPPRATGARGEIVFSILSAQGQASTAPLWQPLLDDMARAIDAPVTPHFAADYAALVAAMRRGETQAAWLSPQPAVEAIDTADAEVIARTVDRDGRDSYRSTLIVNAASGLTLEAVMACGGRLNYGIADAHSTSGALAPTVFLFNPRGVSPEICFRTTRTANHERNAFDVAASVIDVAASNSVTAETLRQQNPAVAEQVRTIWTSPPIPEGGILVRETLDPVLKEKIRTFFLTYGRGDSVEAERQRKVLAGLGYSRFNAADGDYLDPVREIMADEALSAARASGDRPAFAAAEKTLGDLRRKREVQP